MNKQDKMSKRVIMIVVGVILVSLGVGLLRLSQFGIDAFGSMNLGIAGCTPFSFGTVQLATSFLVLIPLLFLMRECVGMGTILGMILTGYGADFVCWLVWDKLSVYAGIPGRIGFLIAGSIVVGMGLSFCLTAQLGVTPYDGVAPLIVKLSKNRLSFRAARSLSDISCVLIGIFLCLMSKQYVWHNVGIGTVCNALFNGTIINFFRVHLAEPILNPKVSK